MLFRHQNAQLKFAQNFNLPKSEILPSYSLHLVIYLCSVIGIPQGLSPNQTTLLVDLLPDDKEFIAVEEEMQTTIRQHRDNGHSGGVFCSYNIIRVSKTCRIQWDSGKKFLHVCSIIFLLLNFLGNQKVHWKGQKIILFLFIWFYLSINTWPKGHGTGLVTLQKCSSHLRKRFSNCWQPGF